MHAIPTMYGGTQFRSRLEARWAAFFDLLEWPWDYEPIDLAGYIPDFLIRPADKPAFLVEVKGSAESVPAACAKITRAGWRADALVVTDAINEQPRQGNAGLVLGTLGAWWEEPGVEVYHWWEAGILMRDSEGRYGLSHCLGSFSDLLHYCDWKKDLLDSEDVRAIKLWREAGNRVQWRSPRVGA